MWDPQSIGIIRCLTTRLTTQSYHQLSIVVKPIVSMLVYLFIFITVVYSSLGL